MDALANQIFEKLKQMDREAKPLPTGEATGLRGYYAWKHGAYGGRRTAWENSITQRLAELLEDENCSCCIQQRYGGGRETCDMVVTSDQGQMWIEAKCGWKTTIGNDPSGATDPSNSAFKKHHYTTAADAAKLTRLRPPEATHVGLLLVGFSTQTKPITDDDIEVVREATAGWQEASTHWNDHAWPGRCVWVWFWWKPLDRN